MDDCTREQNQNIAEE